MIDRAAPKQSLVENGIVVGTGLTGSGRSPGRRRSASTSDIAILCAWAVSFTIGLDFISELKAYDVISLVCIVRFRRVLLAELRKRDLLASAARWFLVIAAIGAIVTIAMNGDLVLAAVVLLRLFRLTGYVLTLFTVRGLIFSVPQLRVLMAAVAGAAAAQAALIVFQAAGVIPILWPSNEMIYGATYPTGTLGLNHLNSVLFMTIGLAAVLSLLNMRKRSGFVPTVIAGGVAALMPFAMLVGEARSAIIALSAFGAILLRRLKALPLIFAVSAIAVSMSLVLDLGIVERWQFIWNQRIVGKIPGRSVIVSDLSQLDRARPMIWKDTVERFLDAPQYLIIGAGFQNFSGLRAGSAAAGHNLYLHVLGELGVPGLISFCALLFGIDISLRSRSMASAGRLRFYSRTAFFVLLILGLFNESLYPQRAIMGFMGFAFFYFAAAAHVGWEGAKAERMPRWVRYDHLPALKVPGKPVAATNWPTRRG